VAGWLSRQVLDGSLEHLDAIVELAQCVVAIVAQPTPEGVVVVVVVEYWLDGVLADRTGH